jgi:hypothetical protein
MEAENFTHWVRVAILIKLLILKEIQAILRVELTDSGSYKPQLLDLFIQRSKLFK